MNIVCLGGGPSGLYFSILMKKADPSHQITIYERNRLDDTFGFGVVFSDATYENLAEADPETHEAMTRAVVHWDDIDIHYKGKVLTSTGHGFSGMARQKLLDLLARRAEGLGVDLKFQHEINDVAKVRDADLIIAADGFNSTVRNQFAEHFRPTIDWRPNRFVWLGT